MSTALSTEQARRVYDRLGSCVDWTAFYEGRAVRELIRLARFDEAHAVVEFGCGTGRVASELLAFHLLPDCRYTAVDISPRMVELARRRLAKWSDRTEVVQSKGGPLPYGEGSFDRFISTFVFDLLEEEEIRRVVDDAHRVLKPGGLLCLTSLAHPTGPSFPTWLWERLWSLDPRLVGGCRPIDLRASLTERNWRIDRVGEMTRFGLTSAVLVASRRASV
jgi:ubiquinone/menaquinone biosynthesis C-methylase UbiE